MAQVAVTQEAPEERQEKRLGGVTPVPAFDALRKQVDNRIPDEAVRALLLEKPNTALIARANSVAEGINKASGDMCFEALKNRAVASLFAKNPDNFLAIAQIAQHDASPAFKALANPVIAEAYEKNAGKVIGSFGTVFKAFKNGSYDAFDVLSNDSIAGMFVENAERLAGLYGKLDKELGFESGYALGCLKNDAVARSFADNPEKIIGALGEIYKSGYGQGMFISGALGKDSIAGKFAEAPEAVAGQFEKIISAAGRDNIFPVFTALSKDEIAGLFVSNPERLIGAFSKIAGLGKAGSFSAFKSLENGTLAKLFAENPERMADAFNELASAGEGGTSAFWSIGKPRVAEFFVNSPKELIRLSVKVGGEAENAFKCLENPAIAGMFSKRPDELINAFGQIASMGHDVSLYAFGQLSDIDGIARMFSANPGKVVEAFGQIAKNAGNGYADAFNALRRESITKMFERDTEGLMRAYKGLADALGENSTHAFKLLWNDNIARTFTEKPDGAIGALKEIAHGAGEENAPYALSALGNARLAKMFATDTDRVVKAFMEIAEATGEGSGDAFSALGKEVTETVMGKQGNDRMSQLFVSDTDTVVGAFRGLAQATGKNKGHAFGTLYLERIAEKFVKYAENPAYQEKLLAAIFSEGSAAIETGRPIDDLHESPAARAAYIKSLSAAQVIGLLCSDPGYFFTSSNHMLFDMLRNDIANSGGAESALAYLEKKYDLDSGQMANLVFRAVNYGRLLGAPNSVFGPADTARLAGILLGGIRKNEYDFKYYYLLANSVRNVAAYFPGMEKDINAELAKAEKGSDKRNALTAIKYLIRPEGVDAGARSELQKLNEKAVYKRSDYAVDGKVRVLQVFSKKDTEKDHWPLTKDWFRQKYGKPVSDDGKEIVYEGKGARVVLYMGDDEKENTDYARQWVGATNNGIITFRGHSYSLEHNMPYDVFGNTKGKYIFIPGSCGSAGSVPQYMNKNPKTDLRHFSNTSTGRGQVTNAIVDILLDTAVTTRFPELLRANERKIRANGGDLESINSIRVWCEGELLTNYVISRQEKKADGGQP
jgi:hypothetical protein